MTPCKQTRFSNDDDAPIREVGNCLIACVASLMDKESAEDIFQIQEHFHKKFWTDILVDEIVKEGYTPIGLEGHQYNDEYYIVYGYTNRSDIIPHACIYQNGKLVHDPHPDNTGVINIFRYWTIEKI